MYELKEEVARKNIVNVKVKIYETFSIDSAGKTRRGIFSLTMSKQLSENVAKSKVIPCTEYLKIGPHHITRAAFDNCRQMSQQ